MSFAKNGIMYIDEIDWKEEYKEDNLGRKIDKGDK